MINDELVIFQRADILYISDKLVIANYLVQYDQYLPRFSYFAVISKQSTQYDKLGKYWSYCHPKRAMADACLIASYVTFHFYLRSFNYKVFTAV